MQVSDLEVVREKQKTMSRKREVEEEFLWHCRHIEVVDDLKAEQLDEEGDGEGCRTMKRKKDREEFEKGSRYEVEHLGDG